MKKPWKIGDKVHVVTKDDEVFEGTIIPNPVANTNTCFTVSGSNGVHILPWIWAKSITPQAQDGKV
jgi:hypothetical protein